LQFGIAVPGVEGDIEAFDLKGSSTEVLRSRPRRRHFKGSSTAWPRRDDVLNDAPQPINNSFGLKADIARVGLNYKFN